MRLAMFSLICCAVCDVLPGRVVLLNLGLLMQFLLCIVINKKYHFLFAVFDTFWIY